MDVLFGVCGEREGMNISPVHTSKGKQLLLSDGRCTVDESAYCFVLRPLNVYTYGVEQSQDDERNENKMKEET